MKIVVFDVAAEQGGAMTILKEFYKEIIDNRFPQVEWCLVVGKPYFVPAANLKIIRLPWVKKSWIHRLFFEIFTSRKVLRKEKADVVFSLQNVLIHKVNIPQVIYLHQSIPFSDLQVSFLSSPIIWVYKYIVGLLIFRSVRYADLVFVQTRWMRDAVAQRVIQSKDKLIVVKPAIATSICPLFVDTQESRHTFFYPAEDARYKNHNVILQALKILGEEEINNIKVIFTLEQDSSFSVRSRIAGLPVKMVGRLPYHEVLDMYSRSVLVFPSLLETFGLPLLEARECGSIIIASDLPFSREILDHYPNACFFNPHDPYGLAVQMKKVISGDLLYVPQSENNNKPKESQNGWTYIVSLLVKAAKSNKGD